MSIDFESDEKRNEQPPRKQPPPTPPKSQLGNIKHFEGNVKATNWKFGKKIFENSEYMFKTLEIEVGDNDVGYTIGQYLIRGNEKTPWIAYNKDALYYIRKGNAWFMIGDDGKTLEIGYYVCVPAETRHCILNNQAGSEVLVDLIFPGMIKVS